MMFDYIKHFHLYCRDTGLDIRLSFEMPQGYETANGTFDIKTKTVFIATSKKNPSISTVRTINLNDKITQMQISSFFHYKPP